MAKLNIKQQRAIQHHLNEHTNLKLGMSVPSIGMITFIDRKTKEPVDVSLTLMELNYTAREKKKSQVKARMKKELDE